MSRYETVVTPQGEAWWSKLDIPTVWDDAAKKNRQVSPDHEKGEFSMDFRLDHESGKPLMDHLEQLDAANFKAVADERFKAFKEKYPKSKVKDAVAWAESINKEDGRPHVEHNLIPVKEVLGEDGEPVGQYQFRFKLKSLGAKRVDGEIVKSWHNNVEIRDAANNKVPDGTLIGNGSKVMVAFKAIPYTKPKVGMRLELVAVQVIDLVPYGGSGNFNENTFQAHDDGYKAPVVSKEEEDFMSAAEEIFGSDSESDDVPF